MLATKEGLAHNDPRLRIGTNAQASLDVGVAIAYLRALCSVISVAIEVCGTSSGDQHYSALQEAAARRQHAHWRPR